MSKDYSQRASSSRQDPGTSGDYYTSSSTTHRDGRSTNLPPIRDVVGDVLQQPVRPVSSGYDSRRPMDRSYTMSPQPQYSHTRQSSSGPHLHPIQSQRYPDNPSQRYPQPPGQYHASSSSQPPVRQQYPPPRSNTPGHSYDVFVSTQNAGLIHKRSSARDDFTQIPREDAIASSTGKHVCPECHRRFEKLSTLKNHLTTHSGEKPHVCPECGKTFSVSSNMRRHQLTHKGGGPSH